MSRAPMFQNVSLSVWFNGFCDPEKYLWFSIDVGEHKVSKELKCSRTDDDELGKIIQPILEVTSNMYLSVLVALDHFVYTIGSTGPDVRPYIRERYIQRLDTTCVEAGWKRYQMEKGRLNAHVAILDGDIYIFGGESCDESMPPSAEVFYPLTGRVELLPDGHKDNLSLVGVDCVLKRIVFVPETAYFTGTEVVSFYYPKIKEWVDEIHPKLGYNIFRLAGCPACVVVGTTIYWFVDLKVKAYDLVKRELYYSMLVEDLPGYPDDWEDAYPFLIHMKEDCFCIIWFPNFVIELKELKYKQVHCTKLRISNCSTNNKLSLCVLDTETYLIHGHDFHVMNAVPVKG